MRFYIASSFQNIKQVRHVANALTQKGFVHTYDWTQNEKAETLEQLRCIGEAEKQAVTTSDFVVILLPGGKGAHIELGIALALSKRLYLYSPTDELYNPSNTSTFYHVKGVNKFAGDLDEFIHFLFDNE